MNAQQNPAFKEVDIAGEKAAFSAAKRSYVNQQELLMLTGRLQSNGANPFSGLDAVASGQFAAERKSAVNVVKLQVDQVGKIAMAKAMGVAQASGNLQMLCNELNSQITALENASVIPSVQQMAVELPAALAQTVSAVAAPGQVATSDSTITVTLSSPAEVQALLSALKAASASISAEAAAMEQRVAAANASLPGLRGEVEGLEAQLTALRAERAAKASEVMANGDGRKAAQAAAYYSGLERIMRATVA